MGYQTTRGLPIPFGFEGNNVPSDLLAFAQRLDLMFTGYLATSIDGLGGVDLWDGRIIYQGDTNAARPWPGWYAYRAALGIWQALIPTAAATYTPLDVGGAGPILGTGAENIGKWCRLGTHVLATFSIYTGSAGYTNGNWVLRAPVAPLDVNLSSPASSDCSGAALFTDTSLGTLYPANIVVGNNLVATQLTLDMEGTTGGFSSTVPVTIAATDTLVGCMFYEAAEQTV